MATIYNIAALHKIYSYKYVASETVKLIFVSDKKPI